MEMNVLWWNEHPDICNSPGMWDQFWLEHELLHDFTPVSKDEFESGVVIIPGRFHTTEQDAKDYADFLKKCGPVLTIITSDEEAAFHEELLPTKNHKLWVMTPSTEKNYPKGTRFLGSMPSPGVWNNRAINDPELAVAFMGQVTHEAREIAAEQLRKRDDVYLVESSGFTQGEEPADYADILSKTQIAPCPPGPVSPDSFRLYEALEQGALPVLNIEDKKYWTQLYGKLPPVLYTDGWGSLNQTIDKGLHGWLKKANRATAWWKREKWAMRQNLIADLNSIGYIMPNDAITFLISISPIHSHPDDSILAETVDSIEERMPGAQIFLMFDGVRKEQLKFTDVYQQHIRNVLARYQKNPNIVPIIMPRHQHQAVMTRRAIEMVRSPLVCFLEHDTPLIGDIPWQAVADPIFDRKLDIVRLYHEAVIQKNHEYLMLDHEEGPIKGFTRTCQWSQRPHVARTNWYRQMLRTYFGMNSRTMIEDEMYSVVTSAWNDKGMEGWEKFRIAIYNPGGDIKRSTHLDGRGSEPKFPMKLAYDGERPEFAPFARVL